jgi:5-methylcytosine-specific restriction endonuclease McrA
LSFAKKQIEQILNTRPQGQEFDGFTVQVDLARMKERKRLVHLGVFDLDDVFPYITIEETKREYTVGNKIYQVRMNSDRYHVFKANNKCVSCGLEGTKMILDMNPGDSSPHFNLYAEEHGRLVLMTKDHVLAKSKGGIDNLHNYQTMCCICNNLKGAYDLTLDDCRELRRLYDNSDKLPRKELRDLINKKRDEMAIKNALKEG